ncbi:P2X purinoceptor 4b [Chanos chanos]|uniref:P2X purinoceptor n=1 Tax=Chanos chanos TaxID=29144 RepID=A0A6J2UM75_CHACN|nr:P2X purinoceptor 4-like [Chanos chanos]
MAVDNKCCDSCFHCFFDYETPVTLVISSKRVGLLFRFIQLLIVAYVAVYVCWYQRGYQDSDSVISSVTTKVKGTAVTNTSVLGVHVWDVAEYVIPPQGESSFFILTNVIVTPGQTQSTCPETPSPATICHSNSDCTVGHMDVRGNGVQTGLCANYSDTVKTCEVRTWCPLENDSEIPKPAMMKSAEQFTVLIKNNIIYPKFNFSKRNILPHVNSSYLKRCIFHRTTDPHCPIFCLGDVVEEAGEDFDAMAIQGGVMGILIDWSCDLDMAESLCVPKYSFQRLDSKNPSNNVAPGYNFRFAKYFKDDENGETRTLIKAYGIRFDVIVFGKAGRFSIVQTIVNLGATLAFLSLVNAVCDWVMLTFMEKRDYYSKHKFIHLDNNADGARESLTLGETAYGTQ